MYANQINRIEVGNNDENIGNHRYIGTWILWIYQIYISKYFDAKYR